MRLRQFLKNLVKAGPALSLSIIIFSCQITGCTYSTKPTYLRENIAKDIQKICKDEYNIDVKVRLLKQTLWIYLPLENLLVRADKPQKYIERFALEENEVGLKEGTLKLQYIIKVVPEKEKLQEAKTDDAALEKINNVFKVMRRVIFSMSQTKTDGPPEFICLVTADIKNGFEIKEILYYLDLKKVSYQFISWVEFEHRSTQDTNISPEIIGDKEGAHVKYKDITLKEFIISQVQQRIRLKFQKPEVDKNADIDKEILKIVVYTIKTYNFKDFSFTELNNLVNNNKVTLNRSAIWARPTE